MKTTVIITSITIVYLDEYQASYTYLSPSGLATTRTESFRNVSDLLKRFPFLGDIGSLSRGETYAVNHLNKRFTFEEKNPQKETKYERAKRIKRAARIKEDSKKRHRGTIWPMEEDAYEEDYPEPIDDEPFEEPEATVDKLREYLQDNDVDLK